MDTKWVRLAAVAGTVFFVAACSDGGTSLSLEPQGFECEGSSCDASFVIENHHDTDAELAYQIELFRTIDQNGNGVPESMVGEAHGTITLEPQERQVVTEQIDVTDEPNGMSAGYSTLD